VRAALTRGDIADSRYQSYLALRAELEESYAYS
jgi:putative ribosome biogenesis GTPase RsgA